MNKQVVTSLLLLCGAVLGLAEGVVNTQPTIDRAVVNVTVVEGRTAILPCTVHNLGRHKVVWSDQWNTVLTFNKKRVIDDTRISVQGDSNEEWNLKFDRVKYGDQGTYECQINTTPGLTQPVSLIVVVPPRITSEMARDVITVREGDRATLNCNSSGIPAPSVTWHKQPDIPGMARESESCPATSRIGHTGEILVIHNVTRHCGGMYECVADNGVPPKDRRSIDVRVKFPPEVQVANRRMGQVLGKDTVLECMVSGYPPAVSTWLYKGQTLTNTEKYAVEIYNQHERLGSLTISLTVKDLDIEDYGHYTCEASNDAGKANDKTILYQYHVRNREPSTTTTTTTTTTQPYHAFDRAYPTQYKAKGNAQDNGYIPKGREGIGYDLKDVIRARPEYRTNERQTNNDNNPKTRPVSSYRRDGNAASQTTTTLLLTVISLSIIQVLLSFL